MSSTKNQGCLRLAMPNRASSHVCAGIESFCATSKKDLFARSVLLTSIQKTPQNLLTSIREMSDNQVWVYIHLSKAICELEAHLALPLTAHAGDHNPTLRLTRGSHYGIADNTVHLLEKIFPSCEQRVGRASHHPMDVGRRRGGFW